jgi:hypothetical protein
MKIRFITVALLLALAVGNAFGHGNKVHVSGILEKINADSVMVKSNEGKSVEVKLAAATVYVERINNQDKPAKVSDLAIGDMLYIHATPKDNGLEADDIKFAHRAGGKTAAPATPKPQS